jgi:glycosyltransferase involved in cell wall biosynthesis
MKLVIFNEHTSANLFQLPIIEEIKKLVNDCLVWGTDNQKNLEYFIKNKDNRIYENALNYCEDNNIEYFHLPYLVNPELFLAELNYRQSTGKLKTKISFCMDWRLIEISKARQLVIYEILQKRNIDKMFIYSSLGEKSRYDGALYKDFFNNSSKVFKLYIPIFGGIESKNKKKYRELYNLSQDKFILLFFGAMYYGKGIDLLLEAMKKVRKNILLFIVSGEGRINFELDDKLLIQNNVFWRRENPEDSKLSGIFATCDAVALPYRATYKNCGSSVFVQSIKAHKPVIMPCITPFMEIVNEYNLGLCFEPENVNSLVETINKMYFEYTWFYENANYDKYISRIQSWKQYVEMLFR